MSRICRAAGSLARVLIACLLLCRIAAVTPALAAVGQTDELLIGIEPEHNIFDLMEQYRALATYLSAQLGVQVKLTIMSRYGEVLKRFKTLKLDGAFLTSYTASMGIRELNLEPVVNPVNLSGVSTAQGYVFVRKDSGIRDVKAMQGRSIVFVDPATMEGYLFSLAYLNRQGVTGISQFFNRVSYSGSHASAIFTVLDGRADIGSAKNTVFDKLVQSDPSIAEEMIILAASPNVPESTLCLRREIDQQLREKLAAVLLAMDQNAAGQEALRQFKALRFIKSSKADFVTIDEMAQEAQAALDEPRSN